MHFRIAAFLFMSFGVVVFPAYFWVAVFVFLLVVFPYYIEGLLFGILMDAYYFQPDFFADRHIGYFTVSFLTAMALSFVMKKIIHGENLAAKSAIAVVSFCVIILPLFLFF